MKVYSVMLVALVCILLLATACQPVMPEEEMPNMANPASVFCGEQGGTLEIRTQDDGGQVGFCLFDDGSECEEWAFIRGECAPSSE